MMQRISKRPSSHHHNSHVYILNGRFGLKREKRKERVLDLL
jgi:hypothetical protein